MADNASSTNQTNEMFGQASRTIEAALKSGIRIQEESTKWFAEILRDLGSPQKWQKRTQTVMEEAIAATQRNIDEVIRVMNQNTKTGLDLLQKAFEARQSESAADAQNKTREWWEAALGALRANTESAIQANTLMLNSWRELARKMNGDVLEQMAGRMREGAERVGNEMRQGAQDTMREAEKMAEQVR